ncbi:MAG: BlaI/MecI/CopY family transcriptional regulator [Phycisphaerae bacterium]|nr:BlaI/MecI/CopY family transcriptional regulator [Phycisphaerae bacterium]
MRRIPRISEAEWQVMKPLWAKSPQTANQIVEALSGVTSWHPKTIRTLLNRLIQKKALGFDRRGREYLYYPLVEREACARAESRGLLRRVFDGAVRPMLASMIESEDLSAEDIRELKRILKKKE